MQPQHGSRIPIFPVLQDGNFRNIWYVGVLVEVSRRLELLVLSWFVLLETGSPFQLGLVVVFLNSPRPLLSPFTGLIADRFSRHRILLVSQILNALVATGILLLFATDLMQPWHVFVVATLQGVSWSLDFPSRRTAIFDIVGARWLVNAMALENLAHTLGRLAGPLLGGILISLAGSTGAYGFVVVVHLMGLALLLRVIIPATGRSSKVEPVLTSLMMGLRHVLHSPMLLAMLHITIAMNALIFSFHQFIPDIGRDHLEVGVFLVGLLFAADGIGQLVSVAGVALIRNPRYYGLVFVLGSLTCVLLAGLFVWSPWYALTFTILTVSGVGLNGFAIMQSSIAMLWSPQEVRGRTLGLLTVCIGTASILGTLEMGAVAEVLGTQWSISLNALAAFLVILPVLAMVPVVWQPSREPPLGAAQG